ncbi:MAG: glutathione S-transferase, partial [Phenylobacterium sp.]|nr:glutathione S-transferase [Phenylobacterium sp.]
MALEFHFHPLSSYCWKGLIALYELGTPFEPVTVDLGDPQARAAYLKLSPFGKIPALRDTGRGAEVYETSLIVDYLDQHCSAAVRLIPEDRDAAREVHLRDRLFDLYVHSVFQRIVADRFRPEGQGDPLGVEQARGQLREAYDVLERDLDGRTWAAGEAFTLADCAAAPALFYADLIEPIGDGRPVLAAYLQRLRGRPSVARVIEEAK